MNKHSSDLPLAEMLPTQSGYNAWAPSYDDEDNPLVLLESRFTPPLLPPLAGATVLDLGCGTGRHGLSMAAGGATVTGVDFSPAMLSMAAAKPGAAAIEFVRHDLNDPLPFDHRQFDLVTCHLVTDHIANLNQLFVEMARVCRVGGYVVNTCMHPAMHLLSVTARFIDPKTGVRIPIETEEHRVSEYVMAAVHSGLQVESIGEHALTADLAAQSPRAEKYIDWPMLLTMRLAK